MIKVAGALLFIIGGIVLGRSVERTYAQKINFWREVLSFITFCKSEIEKYGVDLDEICKRQRARVGRYICMIADTVQYNKTTDEDCKILSEFASELRETGLGAQQNVFSFYEKLTEQRMEKAKDAYEKKGKTYFRLIPILVLGIAVLLW